MTNLSDFLKDMRDNRDIYIQVSEHQLRGFAQQSKEWEKLAGQHVSTIAKLKAKVTKLEEDIILYQIENRSLKNRREKIDLFA